MIQRKLYIRICWEYAFKFAAIVNNRLDYSQKARELLALMDTYIIMNDGLDECEDGTILCVKCYKDEIEGIIKILNENGFADWRFYAYVEGDDECIFFNEPYE
jgi:hypothetical protein